MRAVVLLSRILLGLVFVVAGVLKGMSPYHSALTVGGFQLTSPEMSLVAGIVLPGIEVVAGIALLTGIWTRGAALIGMGLGLSFTLGVAHVMRERLDIDCGCFGHLAITPRAGVGTLTFDAALVVLSLIILLGSRR